MAFAQRLAEADPDNAVWQRDLALGHGRIAAVKLQQDDRDGALEGFIRGMKSSPPWRAPHPTMPHWQTILPGLMPKSPALKRNEQGACSLTAALPRSKRRARASRRAGGLEGVDGGGLGERQADSSSAFNRQCLRNVSTSNNIFSAVGPGDLLGLEVDGEDGVGAALGVGHQRIDLVLRQRDQQEAVLERIVEEDVGEGGADHHTDSVVDQRPGRVLAARAAAEVVADGRAPWGRDRAPG